jgi:putative DNA primase/helicase
MRNISEHAQGRWRGILSNFGIDSRFLTGKHGPCPLCGGKDRWRWDNKDGRGSWFCTHDGAGDGFALLMKVKGWDFPEAARQVETVIGKTRLEPAKTAQTESQKRTAKNRLWKSSAAVTLADPVGKYLSRRIGLTEFPKCIRFAPGPMMVAMMTDPTGKPSTLHRTYLTEDGRKANLAAVRRMMPGTIAKGSAVRLAPYTGVLGIAEGIETALSATALTGVPCWAALTEGLLASWQWPEDCDRIVIFGDNDENYVGQSAAYALARRIGLGSKILVEVRIPEIAGCDWNDVLRLKA